MAQNFQVGDLLPDSTGRPHSYARGVFNAAASDHTLALKQGIGRVISKPDQDVSGDNRKAGSSVEDDGNEKGRCAIGRLKEEVNNNGWARGIIGHSRHGKITTVSRGRAPVK